MTWIVLAGLALAYCTAARRVHRWPLALTTSWLAGLATIAVALGPLDGGADRLLSLHMVQHELLALLAAPLLVAAAPVRLLLRTLDPGSRRALAGLLASAPVRVLARPAAGVGVFAGVLALVHVPAVYDAALAHPALHAIEHAALFWSAVALWVPLVAPQPLPRRPSAVTTLGTLVAAMGAMGALGAWLAGTDGLMYTHYAAAGAVADQRLAGGLMWVGGMVVVLPALLAFAWRALAEEERRQRVREARA